MAQKKDNTVLSEEDILKQVAQTRQKLADVRFNVAINEEKNVSQISKLKKEIARSLTQLNQMRSQS